MRQERDDALPPRSNIATRVARPAQFFTLADRVQPLRRPVSPTVVKLAHDPSIKPEMLAGDKGRAVRRVDGTLIPATRQRTATRPKAAERTTSEMIEVVPDEVILELPPRPAARKVAQPVTPQRARLAVPTPAGGTATPFAALAPNVCPLCYGAGYVRKDVPMGHPAFGKAVACQCKEADMERRRREELWKLSSLSAFQEMTFTTFNPKVQGTREAWDVARHYADDPDGWLVLSGPCGSGKTHLAAAIANHQFQQGTLVLFAVVPQLLDHLRAAFAPSSETTYDALFQKVCEAGLLVLDDLGAEHTTPWAQEKLFQIINHRYMYGVPTVITTNLELINDLDDRVRSRLTDISMVRHMRLSAADYRPHHTPPRKR